MTSVFGAAGAAVLIAVAISSVYTLVEIHYQTGARLGACITWQLLLYMIVMGIGNTATTVFVALAVGYDWAGAWSPLMHAIGGLGLFYGVVNNINITYLDRGILAIQDLTRKTRYIAEEAALEERTEARGELRRKMEEVLPQIPEDKLNTHLIDCCDETDLIKRLEEEAADNDGDPKLYKAFELVDRAPGRATDILKILDKDS